MLAFCSFLLVMAQSPNEFDRYIHKPDASFTYREVSTGRYEVVSQKWQGAKWRHTLTIEEPEHLDIKNAALLIITGGKVNNADIDTSRMLAKRTGMQVATLFDIPNQPLYGRNEDDLIAYTFQNYIDTGDAEWPLLFPMAKSALRAMDVVEQATASTKNPIKKFVVTGASKRGWTTWFVGASGDRRVIGIAPMVIDNLNITEQMKYQIDSWGHYSEMIGDYTRRDLQEQTASTRGTHLASMVDPYSYRSYIKAPTLIINGANDRYWTTDALSLYWDGLKQPKSVSYVPNKGHEACDSEPAFEVLAAFARSIAGRFAWPSLTWTHTSDRVVVNASHAKAAFARLWVAVSDDLDFHPSKWEIAKTLDVPTNEYAFAVPVSKKNVAFYVELRFDIKGYSFSLCTRTWIQRAVKR